MRRPSLTHLLPAAVVVAVLLLALAATAPSADGRLAAAGLAVLLLAPWVLVAAIGVRAGLRRNVQDTLLVLALILGAVLAALW
jgi:hypothetical protein